MDIITAILSCFSQKGWQVRVSDGVLSSVSPLVQTAQYCLLRLPTVLRIFIIPAIRFRKPYVGEILRTELGLLGKHMPLLISAPPETHTNTLHTP